jgi:hypothetical protein
MPAATAHQDEQEDLLDGPGFFMLRITNSGNHNGHKGGSKGSDQNPATQYGPVADVSLIDD